jgi:hypothetical protein
MIGSQFPILHFFFLFIIIIIIIIIIIKGMQASLVNSHHQKIKNKKIKNSLEKKLGGGPLIHYLEIFFENKKTCAGMRGSWCL